MRAQPGDHIILAPPTVDGPLREGEVVEARGADGEPPYVVRWSDGHEGFIYPGPGAVLRVTPSDKSSKQLTPPAAPAESRQQPEQHSPSGARLHARDWHVRISVLGDDDDAEARVVLVADSPKHLTAHGHSHRSSSDRSVPEIGDEVAVARALRRLADRLMETAAKDIEGVTGEHDVTLRTR
ncbi:dsRBD fold-containing protein [Knoellia aerolata]|uniref:DUF1918 domain-containing protein n=1 Tax=Knoellia aerolata DSM 18566 TaxID=1385519 RepID=A0A0A0JXA9_9MICO|nr:dsRBD fold-containing protein [Knoellia aerolata]KGN40221.1 hypothetical protein N801_16265 [Knoellia aerolata DSM 18566]